MRVCVTMAALLLMPTLAFGVIVPQDPNTPDEPALYDIYNTIYGTAYTSNSDAAFLALQTDTELWTIPEGVESITFEVLWRQSYLEDTVGIYTVDGGVPNVYIEVTGPWDNSGLTPTGDPNPVGGQGEMNDVPHIVDVSGLDQIGFYDSTVNPDTALAAYLWHSQNAQNNGQFGVEDGEDHFLFLTTPLENTFLLAFEDMPYTFLIPDPENEGEFIDLGDQDYQDLLIQISYTVIPEPATMALLGMGIAGIAATRRYRKKGVA